MVLIDHRARPVSQEQLYQDPKGDLLTVPIVARAASSVRPLWMAWATPSPPLPVTEPVNGSGGAPAINPTHNYESDNCVDLGPRQNSFAPRRPTVASTKSFSHLHWWNLVLVH